MIRPLDWNQRTALRQGLDRYPLLIQPPGEVADGRVACGHCAHALGLRGHRSSVRAWYERTAPACATQLASRGCSTKGCDAAFRKGCGRRAGCTQRLIEQVGTSQHGTALPPRRSPPAASLSCMHREGIRTGGREGAHEARRPPCGGDLGEAAGGKCRERAAFALVLAKKCSPHRSIRGQGHRTDDSP